MNYRTLLMMIGFFLGVLSCAHAGAKAYDLVRYQGTAAGVTIAFDFAYGYSEASELKVTDAASGKTTKFKMDVWDEMKLVFVPGKDGGKIKSVTLTMSAEDSPPPTVAGSYVAGGKSVSFTLTKSKRGK